MPILQTNDDRTVPFNFPPTQESGTRPAWTGNGFLIGTRKSDVLEYSYSEDGWNDDLTAFHEETAGENHFIDIASREHALRQVQSNVQGDRPVILEIGCSSGFLLRRLKQVYPKGMTIGADIVKAPLERLAKELGDVPLLRFNLVECPLPDNCVDAVIALNVLEHIEDHEKALAQMFRVLKPGGIAVLEVPAGPHLYDDYDRMLKHFRRYKLSELVNLAKAAGFKSTFQSHLGFLLYPGFWAVKKINRLKKRDSSIDEKGVTQSIQLTACSVTLEVLTKIEQRLGSFLRYPTGIRCLLTVSKPE